MKHKVYHVSPLTRLVFQAALLALVACSSPSAPPAPYGGSNNGANSDISTGISPYDQRKNGFLPGSGPEATPGHTTRIVDLFPVGGDGGTRLLSADESGHVLLWGYAPQTRVLSPRTFFNTPNKIRRLAYSEEFGLVGIALPGELVVYALKDRSEIARLSSLRTRVVSLTFQPGRRALLAGGADGRVYLWHFGEKRTGRTGQSKLPLEKYIGASSVVSSVEFHPSGRVFFSGDWHGRLMAWLTYDAQDELREGNETPFGTRFFADSVTRMLGKRKESEAIEQVVVSADGEILLMAAHDGSIEQWDVRGLSRVVKLQAHAGLIYDLALRDDGKFLASAGRDGKLRIWKLEHEESIPGEPAKDMLKLAYELDGVGIVRLCYRDNSELYAAYQDGRIELVEFTPLVGAG